MGFTFNNRELVVNVEVGEVNSVSGLATTPPQGKCKIVNMYVDPSTGKVVVQYDDTPTP